MGKSTFLNTFCRLTVRHGTRSIAQTGSHPAVTRSLSNKVRIHDEPLVYAMDTPGVLMPYIGDAITTLKLALTHTFKEGIVNEALVADYLLYELNRRGEFAYVQRWGLSQPSNSLPSVISAIGRRDKLMFAGCVDEYRALRTFIVRYRKGELGHFMLDEPSTTEFERWAALANQESQAAALKRAKAERLALQRAKR